MEIWWNNESCFLLESVQNDYKWYNYLYRPLATSFFSHKMLCTVDLVGKTYLKCNTRCILTCWNCMQRRPSCSQINTIKTFEYWGWEPAYFEKCVEAGSIDTILETVQKTVIFYHKKAFFIGTLYISKAGQHKFTQIYGRKMLAPHGGIWSPFENKSTRYSGWSMYHFDTQSSCYWNSLSEIRRFYASLFLQLMQINYTSMGCVNPCQSFSYTRWDVQSRGQ